MSLSRTGDLIADAVRRRSGVGAFNVITLEHAEAIASAAELVGAPVILQISENAVRFHGGRLAPIAAGTAEVARAAGVPVALHLDHVETVELLDQVDQLSGTAISSVMIDASRLDYADNVAATRRVVQWGHEVGMVVEAELGEVGGKDGAHAPGVRTRPDEAVAFVAATGVDSLAVAVGSSHAMTERRASLDLDLIRSLREAVPVPLVLHGSSGVPDDELRRAVQAGITKINIGTVVNVAYTGAVRETLDGDPRLVDPRGYLAAARSRMSQTVAQLLQVVSGIAAQGVPR